MTINHSRFLILKSIKGYSNYNMEKDTQTQTFQHFKFTLPILKTRTAIVKGADGKEVEKRYVEGVASSTDLDLHGDRMDPSAIKSMADSLHQHIIKLNAEHDTSWQSELGDVSKLEVSEDNRLLIESELNDMSKAHDLFYALTDLNKKLGLSIGGYVKEYEMVKEEFKNEESGEIEPKWVKHYKNIQLDHIAVTSSPANPKTWVGAIAKSIQESSDILVKKIEAEKSESKNGTMETKKEQRLRDIARNIVRTIQNLEADLLLELTYAGLNILSENQIQLVDTLMIERVKSMKKDVSLEAEEAKKADVAAKSEGETTETPATPENESKETPVATEGEKTETPAKPAEETTVDKPAEEAAATESKEEAQKAAPKDGDECMMPDGKTKGHVKGGKCSMDKKSEESSDKELGKSEEKVEPTVPVEGEAKKAETKSIEKTEEKSTEAAELLQSIQGLTENMKKILETNETLTKRISELEKEPAGRKTIELEKEIGEDGEKKVDAKTLKQEMEDKIAKARKDLYGSPNLFASIQKIRAEYSRKFQG